MRKSPDYADETYESVREFVQSQRNRAWKVSPGTLRRFTRFRGPTLRCFRYTAGRRVAGRPLSQLSEFTTRRLAHLRSAKVLHAVVELQELIYEEQDLALVEASCWVLWQWAATEPICAEALKEVFAKRPGLYHIEADAESMVASMFPSVGKLGEAFHTMLAYHCIQELPCGPGFWLEEMLSNNDVDQWFWFGSVLSCASSLDCRVSELELGDVDSSVVARYKLQNISRSLLSIVDPKDFKTFTGGLSITTESVKSFRVIAGVKKNSEHRCEPEILVHDTLARPSSKIQCTPPSSIEPRYMCTWSDRPFCLTCATSILGEGVREVDPPKKTRGGKSRADYFKKGGLCTAGALGEERMEDAYISTTSIRGVEDGLVGLNCWIGLVARISREGWALHAGSPLTFAIKSLTTVSENGYLLQIFEDMGYFKKRDSCHVTLNYKDTPPPLKIALSKAPLFDRLISALTNIQPSLVVSNGGKVGTLFLKDVALTEEEGKSLPMVKKFIKSAAVDMNEWRAENWRDAFCTMMHHGWASIRGDAEDFLWWKAWYTDHAPFANDGDLVNFCLGSAKQSEKLDLSTPKILSAREHQGKIQIEIPRGNGAFAAMWSATLQSHPQATAGARAIVALRYASAKHTENWIKLLNGFTAKENWIAVSYVKIGCYVWIAAPDGEIGAIIRLHDQMEQVVARQLRNGNISENEMDSKLLCGWKSAYHKYSQQIDLCASEASVKASELTPWAKPGDISRLCVDLCGKYGQVCEKYGNIIRIKCDKQFSWVPNNIMQTPYLRQLLQSGEDPSRGDYIIHDSRSAGFKFLCAVLASVRGYTVVLNGGCCGICLGLFKKDSVDVIRIQ